MNDDNKNILQKWREENKVSSRVFARSLGMNEGNYSKIERGLRNCNPVLAEKIRRLTDDCVQPKDMHNIRLGWIVKYKPDVNLDVDFNLFGRATAAE